MTSVLYMDALALSSLVHEFGSWVAACVKDCHFCCLEADE
jgi:hypothetical protein